MTLAEVLHDLGVPPLGEQNARGWYEVACPFCGGDPYLGVRADTGYVSCWRCGKHGLHETVAAIGKVPYRKVADALRAWVRDRPTPAFVPAGRLKVPAGVGPLLPAHRRYLEGRRFDPDDVARVWGVGGIGIAPRLPWRLYVPVHYRGEVVSWTTRKVTDSGASPRYVSARKSEEAVPARRLLYGEDLAGHGVVVVEGPLDAWRVGPGGVATLGVGFSRAQAARLARFPLRVICFDAEAKAQERARRLYDYLLPLPGKTVRIVLATGKDPSRVKDKEVKQIRKFIT
jgi:hypothetical protein